MKTSKQSILFLTGLLLLATPSCKKLDDAPSAQKNMSTAVSQNASAPQPFNIQDNYDFTGTVLYDDCAGESIDLSGIAHIDIHGVYSNNKATIHQHQNLQGVKGVGETTGNTYVVTATANTRSYTYSNNVVTFSVIEIIKITTAGSANNFYYTLAFAYTNDLSTNTFTVKRDKLADGCR